MTGPLRRALDGIISLSLGLALVSCGGGTTPGGNTGPIVFPTPTPTPTPTAGTCTLRARQDWVLQKMNEWYLFPDTLTSFVNPNAFSNVSDYLDALTANARAQGKDRYFTYVTSIAEENAYYQSGETAGFGFRLHIDSAARRLWVSEVFEGTPAKAAGVDRGTEILAIGTNSGTLQSVSSIMAQSGEYGLYTAMGSGFSGVSRAFQVTDTGGARTVTISKADYEIEPVSSLYGTRIIDDNGRKVGYINLRTFIYTAQPALRTAFATLKSQGVDEVIIDLRYNGGGLLAVAQTLGSLLGGARRTTDVFARATFRPEKAVENDTYYFDDEPNKIAPRKIAFIASESTASASELVINAMRPYLRSEIAMIGTNSYGKPVGQIAVDQTACDDRLRVIAFAVQNADGQSDYFNGLASVMEKTCLARDDLMLPLGDPREDSVARALDFINGLSCTPIGGATASVRSASLGGGIRSLKALVPRNANQVQRDMPGLY